MEDNIQEQDTPQKEAMSLEEAVFGSEGSDSIDSAFKRTNEGTTETAAPVGTPAQGTEPLDDEVDNDKVRYQYWQSEADKYKNELDKYKGMEQQMNTMVQQQQTTQPDPAEPVEQFPGPPEKPQKPGYFNRDEANTDPSSESARYLESVDGWRDDMDEYNALRTEYNSAIVSERLDLYEQNRIEEIQRNNAHQEKNEQMSNIYNHVTSNYKMDDATAKDFMSKMSDPNSISMDNLVQLYKMNQGQPVQPQTNQVPPRSQAFEQSQNAQQIPSPMGVMPSGQSGAETRTMEDKIMDTMIGDFNTKNPWK